MYTTLRFGGSRLNRSGLVRKVWPVGGPCLTEGALGQANAVEVHRSTHTFHRRRECVLVERQRSEVGSSIESMKDASFPSEDDSESAHVPHHVPSPHLGRCLTGKRDPRANVITRCNGFIDEGFIDDVTLELNQGVKPTTPAWGAMRACGVPWKAVHQRLGRIRGKRNYNSSVYINCPQDVGNPIIVSAGTCAMRNSTRRRLFAVRESIHRD